MASANTGISGTNSEAWCERWRGVRILLCEVNINNQPFNSGGFGDIFRGKHPKYGDLALKRLRMLGSEDAKERARRFAREGETWQNLVHPNVLPFLGMDSPDENIYLISPFAEHGTVVDYLKRNPTSDRPKFLRDIAAALGFLHSKGIIHGDIKGRNVLVAPNLDAQVCDFGLARYADARTSTNMRGAGTARWSSLEVLEGQPKSYASDVYAFGMTIAEILSGKFPFSQYQDDVAVITAVILQSERPAREPLMSADGTAYDREWDVAEQCWVEDMNSRLSIDQVIIKLSTQVASDWKTPWAPNSLQDIQSQVLNPTKVLAFRKLLGSCKHIVVLAGAGLSTAAGLHIQRDNDVNWRGYDVRSLINAETFHLQPALVWKFYYDRYSAAQRAFPNDAHRALASLAVGRDLKRTHLPSKNSQRPSLTLVDDTIDGLLDRASSQLNLPSQRSGFAIKIHGSVIPMRCSSCGGAVVGSDLEETSSRWLSTLEEAKRSYESTGVDPTVRDDELPKCSRNLSHHTDIEGKPCMGIYRPGVVWFGEPIQSMGVIRHQLKQCDLFIVAGTSSKSYPANLLVPNVIRRGGRVAVFNDIADADEDPDFLFLGPCAETIPKVLELP